MFPAMDNLKPSCSATFFSRHQGLQSKSLRKYMQKPGLGSNVHWGRHREHVRFYVCEPRIEMMLWHPGSKHVKGHGGSPAVENPKLGFMSRHAKHEVVYPSRKMLQKLGLGYLRPISL
jgi:hypothetical protein